MTMPCPNLFKVIMWFAIVALQCSLMYNEYIVYNPAQIRMRYLLQVRFNYKGGRH